MQFGGKQKPTRSDLRRQRYTKINRSHK